MKYAKYFMLLFLYMFIISTVARDLGLVETSFTFGEMKALEDPNPLEALYYAVKVIIDNVNTMLQFATLQVDSIPILLSGLFVAPFGLGTIIIVIQMIRGV